MLKKRKICVVVASRANYGRIKSVLQAIRDHSQLELQLIVGASTLLYRFGKAVDVITRDGFTPLRSLYYVVEGETLSTQAKSTGLGIVELSTAFEDLQPDIVITVADRFETMSTAIAATYMNIALAHVQGGEITGNIDDRVRHAITKLADIHFVATEDARQRVIQMGEAPETVFNYGCPSIDVLTQTDLTINNDVMQRYGGTGTMVDWTKPYLLVVQHPVTTSYGQGFEQMSATLNALLLYPDVQKIVLWPNIDAGTDDVSKSIRVFREHHYAANFHYYRNFAPEDYARVLKHCVCAVGNSSSFLREGSFLGMPAVIVGDRQEGREHGANVVFADYKTEDIQTKVEYQMAHGRYPSDDRFGRGDAGQRIVERLIDIPVTHKKRMTY